PVNTTLQRHEDGSASVIISNTQQDSQVRWRVRLTLHPDRAYLDEHIRLANERDRPVPYYFWNNTAFYCDPQTRFIAPISLATDHGANRFFRWPIHNGRDLRKLGTYQGPTSLFAWKAPRNFFGAYHLGRDRGVVQWADHRTLPGKKYWTFGEGQHGRYMQNRLTDTEGSHYIELQSGPLATQSDYEFLPPRAVRSWREWWYPVHGLKDGFEYATRDVAIQAEHRKPTGSGTARVELRLIATAVFPDATVTVAQNGEPVHSESLTLTPQSAARLTLDKPSAGPVRISVRDANGDTLAAYTSPLAVSQQFAPQDEPSPQPAAEESQQQPPVADSGASHTPSAAAHYQKAREHHVSMDPDAARTQYEQALKRDPNHVNALRG
ncbi:MAG: DUF5107 domain-containing protein, partial [Salinibacter sp.]